MVDWSVDWQQHLHTKVKALVDGRFGRFMVDSGRFTVVSWSFRSFHEICIGFAFGCCSQIAINLLHKSWCAEAIGCLIHWLLQPGVTQILVCFSQGMLRQCAASARGCTNHGVLQPGCASTMGYFNQEWHKSLCASARGCFSNSLLTQRLPSRSVCLMHMLLNDMCCLNMSCMCSDMHFSIHELNMCL